ncbi:Transcriptional activator protein UGA3 [Elsinoe australis]|uniref:Transcriptional activator protein UGA3 n=1 Tax=Elsinoe australis TaxID=40998 RepID=A0A2P7ZQ21_9PEZI|nr:Transcriptional activator protein UGA3 [Elsinoe australis]
MAQDTVLGKRTRTRSGCLNCRRKRKKCDESKPACGKCVNAKEECLWGQIITFRPENALCLNGSDGLQQVEPSDERESTQSPLMDRARRSPDTRRSIPAGNCVSSERDNRPTDSPPAISYINGNGDDGTSRLPAPTRSLSNQDAATMLRMSGWSRNYDNGQTSMPSPMSTNPETNAFAPTRLGLTPHSHESPEVTTNGTTENAASALMSFRTDAAQTQLQPPAVDFPNMGFDVDPNLADMLPYGYSPEALFDDGIFLPGSAYQELHKTFRSHVFNAACSKPTSRRGTPDPSADETNAGDPGAAESAMSTTDLRMEQSEGTNTPPELTPRQERKLWSNWITEISSWLDKFDIHKHFRHTLPSMAEREAHLRLSMFALSARQLEKKDGSMPAYLSLALYQEAIHVLLPKLHTKDLAVIASCVVLCVLEMFSCSPKAWRRHLDGCANLILSMNVRGDSGGLEEALFWCFARMDVCGGLISSEKTLVPISRWTSNNSFVANVEMYKNAEGFEKQAHYACYLLGRILDLFARFQIDLDTTNSLVRRPPDQHAAYTSEWDQLMTAILDWYTDRPPEMRTILTQPAIFGPKSSPFPTLLFSNPAAIAANQQHHTAQLLMLSHKPADHKFPRKTRSILWHARQICGISITNDHHGCWTNCIQPIWLAGRMMSHPEEHRAIVELYERIERETGWGTKWRVDDLKEVWGDLSV